MLTTAVITGLAVAGQNKYFSPVKLALSATASAVVVTAKAKKDSRAESYPTVKFATTYEDLTANEVTARAVATMAEDLQLAAGEDVGVDYYYKSRVVPVAGGYLYLWVEVPTGWTGTVSAAVVEYN